MNDSHRPTAERRWYHLTPDRFLIGLLAVEGVLLLSERFSWFPFNERKGWTVLIAMATVCVAVLLMVLWLLASLLFRRRFQFSIRSLLVLVVAVAVPCSWLAVQKQQAKRQREVYNVLREFRGIIAYDFRHSSNRKEPDVPAWLMKLFDNDVDFFADLERVCLAAGREFTDAELACVGELTELEFLALGGAGISDGAVEHLRGLTDLEHLSLNRATVSDAGLEHLEGMINLERLFLHGTQVGDAGLEHLAGLSSLQILALGDTEVTDAGLKHLEGLVNLSRLDLEETNVTDAGLQHLKLLTNLETLDLARTQVTDEGVIQLRQALPNVEITR